MLATGWIDTNFYLPFKVDGYEIDLPDLEGVIVLNITNYAGGVSLWEHDPTMVIPFTCLCLPN